MVVSEVNVTPVKPNNGLIAIVSVVIDDSIYLNSIAIYTKLDGSYRLLYPTKRVGNKSVGYHHPINRPTSRLIDEAVFKKCSELFQGSSNGRHGKDITEL